MISQRVQAAVVVLFVLVIAGVVAMLLMRVDRDAPAASGPSVTPGDDVGPTAEGPVGRVSLTAAKGDVFVRFTSGSCTTAGGPKLELSEDQGRTFHEMRVPQVGEGTGVGLSSPAIVAMVAATATAPVKLTVYGADEKCDIHRYTTDDAGRTWNQESGAVETWYVDPRSGGVVSPKGPTDPGCKTVGALAPVSDTAAKVFCNGGSIRSTSDGGDLWNEVGLLKDVEGAVFTSAGTGFAEVSEPGCDSRIQATIDGGVTWIPKACIVSDQQLPGFSGTQKRLVAGDERNTWISNDGGASWKSATTN